MRIIDALIDRAARVTAAGRLLTEATQVSLGAEAARKRESWQVSMDTRTLTTANESAMIYVKNVDPTRILAVDFAFINQGASTGGSGHALVRVYRDITGGTLVTDANEPSVLNRNLSANESSGVIVYSATGEGKTLTGTEFFDVFVGLTRLPLPLDTIQLGKGATLGLSFQPPAGNTSMVAKINLAMRFEPQGV